MNEPAFFAAIRPAFGNKLSQAHVDGMKSILDAAADNGVTDPHHVAHILAHVRRETGGYMSPIKETVMPSHKDKNPSDAEVIRRLDRAFASGKLTWVKKPYWRDGEFGRGQIQLTHASNRAKFGIKNRDDLLKLPISARVAVVGMRDGMFTGKNLADYTFPAALDNPPKSNPRRIVNGQDGSDAEVAKFHRQFYAALIKAGWNDLPIKPATAPKRPAQAQKPAPASRAKETASTAAGGAAGAGVVLLVVTLWNDAWAKFTAFADWITFWN
jgi:predicted chitinase